MLINFFYENVVTFIFWCTVKLNNLFLCFVIYANFLKIITKQIKFSEEDLIKLFKNKKLTSTVIKFVQGMWKHNIIYLRWRRISSFEFYIDYFRLISQQKWIVIHYNVCFKKSSKWNVEYKLMYSEILRTI